MGCLQRSMSCFVAALCSAAALESCPQALPASARVRLLVTTTSGPKNVANRDAIRGTWCTTAAATVTRSRGAAAVAVRFFVARATDGAAAAALASERERRDDLEFLDDFDDTRYTVLLKLLRAVEFFAAHASGPTHWGRIDDDSYAFVDRVAAGLLAPERIKLAPDTKDDAFSADEFVWSFFMERSDFHAAPFAVGFGSIMTAGLARHLAAASLDFGFGRRGDLVANNRDDGCDIGEANDVGVDTRRTGGCFMERFWDDDIFLGMVLWPLKHARLHDDKFHWIAGRDGRASPRGIGPDSIIVNGLVASAGEFEKTFKGDYFGVNADVCVEINHWFGGSLPNFRTL